MRSPKISITHLKWPRSTELKWHCHCGSDGVGQCSKDLQAHITTQNCCSLSISRNYRRRGGVLGYGPDLSTLFHRSAALVDQIIRGAKPGNIPIGEPEKFDLSINLAASRELGLIVPDSITSRATHDTIAFSHIPASRCLPASPNATLLPTNATPLGNDKEIRPSVRAFNMESRQNGLGRPIGLSRALETDRGSTRYTPRSRFWHEIACYQAAFCASFADNCYSARPLGCGARATSGHAAAPPASPAMNARRFIR